MNLSNISGTNAILVAFAVFVILCIFLAVRIVPQSEKHVVERFGRLKSVLGPGINFVVPFLDRVAHRVSVLERQLPNASQDAITADNVLVKVETSVFYRVTEPVLRPIRRFLPNLGGVDLSPLVLILLLQALRILLGEIYVGMLSSGFG